MKNCPYCHAEDSLETYLRIDLDDIVLGEPDEHGIRWVTDFIPALSANDPDTGLVAEEATVSCRECGATIVGAYVPIGIVRHWSFQP